MSMPKWNDLPFNESDSPEQKAANFEAQWNENGGNDPQVDNNPYSKENFNSDTDRRGK
jgi:hypothetical protein